VYSDGEIVARGWSHGVSGVSVKGESRNMMDSFTCVKSRVEDYASELKTNRVGDGNAKNFDEFIKGKDRYENPVKVKKILSNILQPWLSANQQNPFLVETYFTVLKIRREARFGTAVYLCAHAFGNFILNILRCFSEVKPTLKILLY